MTAPPLTELDQSDMRDIARAMLPDLAEEDFDAQWAEFQAEKRRREMQ